MRHFLAACHDLVSRSAAQPPRRGPEFVPDGGAGVRITHFHAQTAWTGLKDLIKKIHYFNLNHI